MLCIAMVCVPAAAQGQGRAAPEAPSPAAGPVSPGHGARLVWTWPEFTAWEAVMVGVGAATVVTSRVFVGPSARVRQGGIWVDEDLRSSWRLSSERARRFAQDTSDVLLSFVVSYPILIDALIVAGWYRESPEVARQLVLLHLEVQAVTAAIESLVDVLFSRERPYGRGCGTELPSTSTECTSSDRYYSFFSGHTSASFAAAALTCSNHIALPLYGGGAPEGLACASGLVLAATTGTLRILGDKHYFTDVLAGAGVGALVGFGLPWLLHYARAAEEGAETGPQVRLVPTPLGASLLGSF